MNIKQNLKLIFIIVWSIISSVGTVHVTAQSTPTLPTLQSATPLSIESAYPPMQNISLEEINKIYGTPAPFNPNRTVEEITAHCKAWQPPVPDAQAQEWYRAATALHGNTFRTVKEHQQMLQLYEGAARRGHYLAMKNLSIVYSQGALVQDYLRFPREPEKVDYWVKTAIQKKYTGALEWVAFGVMNGVYGFKKDERLGLAYMQMASDQGVALAQYQLALYYENVLKKLEQEEALMECAAQQDVSAAQWNRGAEYTIYKNFVLSFDMYQRAVMNGGEYGQKSAFILSSIFLKGTGRNKEFGSHETDPIRRAAYKELDDALTDNMFLRFPRLNEVLPLPPTEVTEWKGIYSAMSPEDAAYYQNPPPAEFYLKQIEEAGLLVPLEYISQPNKPQENQ